MRFCPRRRRSLATSPIWQPMPRWPRAVDRDGDKKREWGMRETLERRIDQAMGRMAADLAVRNARILDLATGAMHSGDIAVCGEMIVGTGDSYRSWIDRTSA